MLGRALVIKYILSLLPRRKSSADMLEELSVMDDEAHVNVEHALLDRTPVRLQ